MSRRKRFRYWAPTGAPKAAPAVVSVKISAAAGGEAKSLVLMVHLPPTWQSVQPACGEQRAPWLDRRLRPVGPDALAGERRARRADRGAPTPAARSRRHGGRAARQRDRVLRRSAFGFANALITHGARLMSPLSPIIRPWLGSSVLVAGGGRAAAARGRERPGARDVADVGLEVLDLVEDRRVVEDPLLVAVARVEAGVQRHRLARADAELPDDAVGQALEVAARAALPALAREPLGGRDGRAGRAG